jgi:hypothetical protein
MKRHAWIVGFALLVPWLGACSGRPEANGDRNAVTAFMALPHPRVADLYTLAMTGEAGREAGPSVMPLLDTGDREVREAAVVTLGRIHYRPAVGRLIALLGDPTEPMLNLAAADSLGQLGDPAAIDALRAISATHWFPPLRVAATQAIRHIRDHSPYPPPDRHALTARDPSRGFLSHCTDDPYPFSRSSTQEDGVTLDVPGGQLVGIDHGEWGGSLRLDADNGFVYPLLDTNVVAIARLGARIVVVTGLSHMGMWRGDVYEATRKADGSWQAMHWRALTGPPLWVAVRADGRMHIALPSYTLLLAADGTMSVGACEEPAPARSRVGTPPKSSGDV